MGLRTSIAAKTLATILFTVFLIGCGQQYDAASTAKYKSSNERVTSESEAVDSLRQIDQDETTALNASSQAIANRKIIYNTNIGLVVEDYDSFENQLPAVVAQRGGFIACNETDRRYNDNQRGTWVVRLPVSQYNEFLNGVGALGFAESRTENAQDVTEEYVDTEARIKNKKKLEVRILEMLDQRKGPLKDVLAIERELARIREEVERMEGRLRFLKDRTSLATVTINCREEKEYQPVAAPTLATRIKNSWTNSLSSLQRGAESFLVGLIGAIPWIVLIALIVGVVGMLSKKYWRSAVRLGTHSS